jgi:hypothetical protein
LGIQDAFFEGKKAEEASPRKKSLNLSLFVGDQSGQNT